MIRRLSIALLLAAAGCRAPTTVLVTVEAAPGLTVAALDLHVMLAGAQAGSDRTLVGGDGGAAATTGTLGSLLVVLPDATATDVTIDASGSDANGGAIAQSAMVQSAPHQETAVTLTLPAPSPPDAGADLATQDLAQVVWAVEPSGVPEDLFAIWGAAPNDVYAVGASGRILHFDGSAWAPRASGRGENLTAIWGSGPNDIWIVGVNGLSLHATDGGKTWKVITTSTSATLDGVWGAGAAGPIYAVGANGLVLRYSGGAWAQAAKVSVQNFAGVWGSSATDLYAPARGNNAGFHSVDGTTWVQAFGAGYPQNALSGWSAGDVVSVGDNGSVWQESGPGTFVSHNVAMGISLRALWGSGVGDFYIVGEGATIAHKIGTGWKVTHESAGAVTATLYGVWGSGGGDVRAVGAGGTIVVRP